MEGVAVLAVLGCVLALALVGLLVGLIAYSRRRERDRRDVFQQWAMQHGWTVVPAPNVDWGSRLPGRNRRGVSLALFGAVGGYRVSVAEYSYTETHTSTSGDGMGGTTTTTSSHSHPYVVIVVHLDEPHPAISVQPRTAVSRIGQVLFGDAGPVTGDQNFDKHYRVAGDPVAVGQLVGPALRAEHLAGTVPLWALHQTELMTYQPGRIDSPYQIPNLAAPLIRAAALLRVKDQRKL
ncbi:hypothetical protein GCM10027614_30460 [Micromonospora vulcania]